MLIELLQNLGFVPKRTSSMNGGEFHSPCPDCGGTDRFTVWPDKDRYWCRQCKKWGDSIQFCRDFFGKSFQEAKLMVGNDIVKMPLKPKQEEIFLPSGSWIEKATKFLEAGHERLLIDANALAIVKARGLSLETIQRYLVGWNPISLFRRREEWGLEKKIEDGKEKKLCLPSGLIIPTFQDQTLHKIKIRRNDWKEGDQFSKYYIVPGSTDSISSFGDLSKEVVVLVEAELDAMLVVQEAGDLCCCIALGGAQKRPKESMNQWLLQKRMIIFALDFDEPGKKEYFYWHSNYENLFPWPVPVGKSPAEARKLGADLKKWIASGIEKKKSDSVLNALNVLKPLHDEEDNSNGIANNDF